MKIIMKTDKNRFRWKLKVFGFIIFLFLIIASVYGVKSFFDKYYLRLPFIMQSPIVPRKAEVIISPVSAQSSQLRTIDIGEIADKIYFLESGRGKNDSCRKLGLYNGFGFRQSSFEWKCFSSHEEVRMLVINWLIDNISKHGLEKALCLYNRGIAEKGCRYALTYKSL